MEKVLSSATDAVLVAGPGLIIQSRKSVVGSNPTRRTKTNAPVVEWQTRWS